MKYEQDERICKIYRNGMDTHISQNISQKHISYIT